MTKDDPASILGVVMVFAVLAAIVNGMAIQRPSDQGGSSNIQPISGDVEIYSLDDLSHPLRSLAWGTLTPSEIVYQGIYVRNNDASRFFKLNMSTSTWNPSKAFEYMSFSWNCTGQVVNPQSLIYARLRLEVLANCTGITYFSFTIIIGYEEVT